MTADGTPENKWVTRARIFNEVMAQLSAPLVLLLGLAGFVVLLVAWLLGHEPNPIFIPPFGTMIGISRLLGKSKGEAS